MTIVSKKITNNNVIIVRCLYNVCSIYILHGQGYEAVVLCDVPF